MKLIYHVWQVRFFTKKKHQQLFWPLVCLPFCINARSARYNFRCYMYYCTKALKLFLNVIYMWHLVPFGEAGSVGAPALPHGQGVGSLLPPPRYNLKVENMLRL